VKIKVYIIGFYIVFLGACGFYLRLTNPAMTETQLLISFPDIWALIVTGIFLAWFYLDRTLVNLEKQVTA
jgi:hypothetical protein